MTKKVRARRFVHHSAGVTAWLEPLGDRPEGEVTGTVHDAACAFIDDLLPGDFVAVTEGQTAYGQWFVSVYYRKTVEDAT